MDLVADALLLLLGVALGASLAIRWRRRSPEGRRAGASSPAGPSAGAGGGARSPLEGAPGAGPGAGGSPAGHFYRLAAALQSTYERVSYPGDLQEDPQFQDAVRWIAASSLSAEDLVNYYRGDNPLMACLATEALGSRPEVTAEDMADRLLGTINNTIPFVRYFALRALHRKTPGRLLARVLSSLDERWERGFLSGLLERFLSLRREAGEPLCLGFQPGELSRPHLEQIRAILLGLRQELRDPLVEEVDGLLAATLDRDFLASVGRVLPPGADLGLEARLLVRHELLERTAAEMLRVIRERRSVLLVGEAGTGKTAATTLLTAELHRLGYAVFQSRAADVLAGQSYIGDLEQRVGDLVRRLEHRQVVWLVDSFQELAVAGLHQYSRTSVLDMLLPHMASGAIVVVGETRPAGLERLLLAAHGLTGILGTVRLEPVGSRETLEIARQWVDACPAEGELRLRVSRESLEEALRLVEQYLPSRAAPGNLIDFLKLAWRRAVAAAGARGAAGEVELGSDDYVEAMAQLTGLPLSLIDERQRIDVDALGARFQRAVLGQPEAIAVLVERVAMIKAGLTDPARPLGVFLFAGPTGTGKTEIAKAFTRFLFGSESRMIRLDMSELQHREAASRLFGDPSWESDQLALVNRIRRQPFSLVLLDEFEKADPYFWDLFLQVFDDGRLTDHRGNTADFRNAIIVLTTNLGAPAAQSPRLGFGQAEAGYREDEILGAIERTFRREFVNRLDRIVVFRPLSRKTMREILRLELASVLGRRGLRNRPWVVEWDDSALEFLLERGFSPELGARPLRRAVERYLLTPLSLAIVRDQVPAREQFLLVSARRGQLEVECIDPEAGPEEKAVAVTPGARLDTRALVLHARGTRDELDHLAREYRDLVALFELESFLQKKEEALVAMTQSGF